jgi:hypothetical protein
LGEIYVEAARVLDEHQWEVRAENIAGVVRSLARDDDDYVTWLVENPHVPTADLMAGCSGVIHFLVRLAKNGEGISFPLLLD